MLRQLASTILKTHEGCSWLLLHSSGIALVGAIGTQDSIEKGAAHILEKGAANSNGDPDVGLTWLEILGHCPITQVEVSRALAAGILEVSCTEECLVVSTQHVHHVQHTLLHRPCLMIGSEHNSEPLLMPKFGWCCSSCARIGNHALSSHLLCCPRGTLCFGNRCWPDLMLISCVCCNARRYLLGVLCPLCMVAHMITT